MTEILIKIGVGALLAIALYFGWKHHEDSVYHRGYTQAVDDRKASDDAELARAKTDALRTERALQASFDKQSLERQQEKQDYEKTINDLRGDVRRGNSGMRAPGACIRADAAAANAGAASGPSDETGSVALLPETAESVLDAAIDLRQGVLDRNALIDRYNEIRAACNGPPPA